jgi:serine/threonine protein kinase
MQEGQTDPQDRLVVETLGGPQTGTIQRAEPGPQLELPPERRANRLAAPRTILLAIPLIVLAVGVTLTVVGQSALNKLSTKMAVERFDQETQLTTQRLESALGQADAVLAQLPQVARDVRPLLDQPEQERFFALSRELLHLATGRPGLTQVYLAFPSGHFLTVHPDSARAPIQLTNRGVTTSYLLDHGLLREMERDETGFDPTTREWYRLGLLSRELAWSEPYTFFQSGQLGVTRVLPIYRDASRKDLLCVAGVDFDVNTLTAFMAESETKDRHSIIFTERGIVLAYPKSDAPKLKQVTTNRPEETLRDPQLQGFFSAWEMDKLRRHGTEPIPGRSSRYLTFEADGEPMVAAVRNLGPTGPRWYVATLSKRRDVQAALLQYRRSSLWIGGLAVAIAMISAWFFARFIVRERREALLARAAARAAQRHARELGSYTLVSRLGEGGMGEVWRARHHLLAREAAIKLIRTNQKMTGPKQRELEERFRREARALAALRSRNTIELFDYGLTSEGTLYYVMELLDGIDLHALVEQFGPQPPERVRQILIQVCHSLSEAHDVKLVHRDIKPANIFLCRAADEVDVVKVLDFGLVLSPLEAARDKGAPPRPDLAKLVLSASQSELEPRLTQADMQLGTPGFMAPEQALGAETDARADLYSLGCVAWWLLTGRPLFEGDTAIGIMLKHIQAPVPDLQELCPFHLSTGFSALVTSCLRKSTDERPQNAHELLSKLRQLPEQPGGWSLDQAAGWWATRVPQEPRQPANVTEPPGPVAATARDLPTI